MSYWKCFQSVQFSNGQRYCHLIVGLGSFPTRRALWSRRKELSNSSSLVSISSSGFSSAPASAAGSPSLWNPSLGCFQTSVPPSRPARLWPPSSVLPRSAPAWPPHPATELTARPPSPSPTGRPASSPPAREQPGARIAGGPAEAPGKEEPPWGEPRPRAPPPLSRRVGVAHPSGGSRTCRSPAPPSPPRRRHGASPLYTQARCGRQAALRRRTPPSRPAGGGCARSGAEVWPCPHAVRRGGWWVEQDGGRSSLLSGSPRPLSAKGRWVSPPPRGWCRAAASPRGEPGCPWALCPSLQGVAAAGSPRASLLSPRGLGVGLGEGARRAASAKRLAKITACGRSGRFSVCLLFRERGFVAQGAAWGTSSG